MQEAPNEYKIDFGPYSVELKSSQVYFKKNNSLMKAIPVKSTFGLYDLKKLAKKVASSVNMTNKLPKDVLKAEKDNGRDLLKGVDESTKEWTKTIKRLAKQDQLKKITSKDKETLLKIVRLMKTANENKIEEDFVKKGFLYKSLTYKVTDQQAVYNAYKKFKMGNKTINIVASNKGDTVTFSGHPQKGPWLAPSIADQLDMAIQKTGKAKLIDSEIKKLKESKMNKSEILFRKMIREIAEPMLTEELNESAIDYRLDPYEDREKLKNQFIKFIISKKRASKNVAKKFVDKHYEKLINIGKDSEILDIYKDLTEAELNEAKYNISKMYPNSTDLERDIVAWYRSLKKDVGEKYAKEMRADLVKVLMREGKLNESREFVIIDPRGNARPVGSKMQASQYTKKMGGPNKGWFIVLKKNALKARRAIEKSGMRYKDSKLQNTMFDLMYEGKLTEMKVVDYGTGDLVNKLKLMKDYQRTAKKPFSDGEKKIQKQIASFIKEIEAELKKRVKGEGKLNEISKQKELSKIETWVRKSGMDYDDWDWDGKELTIFTKSGTEKYSKKDLKDERVFEGKLNEVDRRLSNSQWEALENMNDWLPSSQEKEYLKIMSQDRAPAMIKFLKKYADMKALNKYGVKSSDLKTLAGALMNEGKLTEGGIKKRFTVVTKFRVDGQVFNTGDYAKKKERMGKTMVLNMDNNEMLSIDWQDYVAAVNNKIIKENNINLDTDKLGIVENLTNKEMMDLRNKLKMKQDKPMLTWKSPKGGVDVMIVQSGMIKAIFPHKGDSNEAKIAMKILKVKSLKVVGEGKVNELNRTDLKLMQLALKGAKQARIGSSAEKAYVKSLANSFRINKDQKDYKDWTVDDFEEDAINYLHDKR